MSSVVGYHGRPLADAPFLVCTRRYESANAGGYTAVSRGGRYRGAYQFDRITWDATTRHLGRADLVGADPAATVPVFARPARVHAVQVAAARATGTIAATDSRKARARIARMDGVVAVEGTRDAHMRLLRALDEAGFDDAIASSESALPGWTRGHVLTHLARNADSHTRMIDAAKNGESVAQYPGGFAQRESEIEAGAFRSAADLLADLRRGRRRARSVVCKRRSGSVVTPRVATGSFVAGRRPALPAVA